MSVPPGIHFRPMTKADIDAGLSLCRASRWNQVARDWRQFLDLDPAGAVLACRDTRVVGSVATVRYRPDLAWVAMVLVAPEERGKGIGRALLQEGLALVDDVPVVGLDATPAGRPLYLTLGFTDAFDLRRMQRPGGVGLAASQAATGLDDARVVRPLGEDDWPAVLTLDQRVTGVDREAMLRWLSNGAPQYAWVCEGAAGRGGVDGVVLGRPGETFEHLGPIVATDQAVAQRLVCAALPHVPVERPVVVDAAIPQEGWQAWLEGLGFAEQRPFTRMYRGHAASRGWAAGLFAIIGPEFG
jgi:GNAT superfamily N-acetyltransferase